MHRSGNGTASILGGSRHSAPAAVAGCSLHPSERRKRCWSSHSRGEFCLVAQDSLWLCLVVSYRRGLRAAKWPRDPESEGSQRLGYRGGVGVGIGVEAGVAVGTASLGKSAL